MKLHTLAAACAALVSLAATPALAGETVTAKLSQPVTEKTKFIAGGAMFVCEGDACVALAPTSQTYGSAACKTIAGKLGPVASFSGRKTFDDAKLGACNATAMAKAGGAQLAKQ